MVDLKKEIKLSDLVPRRKAKPGGAKLEERSDRGAGSKRELVGLKVGASQLAAARVMNNGSANLLQLARGPLERGVVVAGEVRDVPASGACARPLLRGAQASAARSPPRPRDEPDRRALPSTSTGSPTSGSSLTRSASGRTRRCRSRSTRRCSTTTSSARPSTTPAPSRGASFWPPPTASRSIATSRHARAANIELYGIDLEAFALLRAVGTADESAVNETQRAVVAVSLGHDRSTLAISDGEVCEFTRVLEWGGGKLESAIAFDLGVTPEEASELKLAASLEEDAAERQPGSAHAGRAGARSGGSSRSSRASSSPRSSSTRARPGRLAISEILVSGGTSRMPGLPEELQRLTRVAVRPVESARAGASWRRSGGAVDLASLTIAIGLGVEA